MKGVEIKYLIQTRYSTESRLSFEPRLFRKCRVLIRFPLIIIMFCELLILYSEVHGQWGLGLELKIHNLQFTIHVCM